MITIIPDWLTDDHLAGLAALRCSKKADRKAMATELTRIAQHYGCTIEDEPDPLNEAHGRVVHIRHDVAYVMIDLDGTCPLHRRGRDTYLGHWNIERGTDVKFSAKFASVVGDRNKFHRQKATLCAEGFGHFALQLAIALKTVEDGSAFE